MASPNSVFTEMVTTTLRDHKKSIADNVAKNNALLSRLTKRGKVRRISSGYEIAVPLDYAENATYQRYSGYDILNISPSDVLSAAKFDWKQAAVNVTSAGIDLRNNSGEEQLISLAKARLNNAIRTFKNNLSVDLYSDGTLSNQIGGLQNIVSDTGLGTVGGINASTYAFWASVVQSAAAPLQGGGAITPSKSTIKSLMNPLWLETVRGGDKIDLIVSSNDYFAYYWESLQDLQRYSDDTQGVAGFQSLKYVTADVIHDGGTAHGSGILSQRMYFLNTDYLELVVHRDADMTELADKSSVNQDAVTIPIIWQGNLTCSNRSLQGVLKP